MEAIIYFETLVYFHSRFDLHAVRSMTLHDTLLPCFIFDTEDGGDNFLWNVGLLPLAVCLMIIYCLALSLTLKMEAKISFETLVYFHSRFASWYFIALLYLWHWRWRRKFSSKRCFTSTRGLICMLFASDTLLPCLIFDTEDGSDNFLWNVCLLPLHYIAYFSEETEILSYPSGQLDRCAERQF
jgi:hypothetical protein